MCSELKKVDLALVSNVLKGSSVPDGNGSPLNVSCIITFRVNDPIKAIFNVDDYYSFIESQGYDIIRKVISRFPFRIENNELPSLTNNSVELGDIMKELLNKKTKIAGINIERMELTEINYSPEMAQSLLQTQQAKAKIEARKYIVEGGVKIVKDAIIKLEEEGIKLNSENTQKLVKDLLIVTCSESGQSQPVLNI